MKNRVKSLLVFLIAALLLTTAWPGAAEKEIPKGPTVLLILDGFGVTDETEHNAIALADTPVMDRLMKEYPFVTGDASGLAVGLPDGVMGSSEVGHLNIGAGRIVYQDLTRITKAIEDGDFFGNEALLNAINSAREKGTALHICGLLSDGGVHSHNTHLYALLELTKRQGLEKVYVHCFTDGRDTPPESGRTFIQELQDQMDRIGCGAIATVSGRYYAMDRDNRWDRLEKAYRALTLGEGVTADSAPEAVSQSYEKGETDEFILPTVVMKDGAPVATIGDGDSVIFFNFRADRARELTSAFCCDDFDSFDRGPRKQVTFVCFTDYDVTIPNKQVAFPKPAMANTLGEWLAVNGRKQARIAETEKYAHVTFFFNGGVEEPNPGEDRFLIPSRKVATYDLAPEMSTQEICDTLVEKIHSGEYDVIIANFANADMVGHTGVEKAAIEAVTFLDKCIGQVAKAVEEAEGWLFICADHGNAEVMVDEETGEPLTSHTTNPVPFILVNYDPAYTLREGGCLADIAPTLLEMMGLEKPEEMTGESLLIRKKDDGEITTAEKTEITLDLHHIGQKTGLYSGKMKGNLPNGKGSFETQTQYGNAVIYEGTWVDGQLEGQGKAFWPGDQEMLIEGTFADSEIVNGKEFYGGIIIYEGGWKDFSYHGQGTLYNAAGDAVYSGTFNHGFPDERDRYTAASKDVSYDALLNDPQQYMNENVKVRGKIVYVWEDEDYCEYLLNTDENDEDKVVYISYYRRSEDERHIQEGELLTVYGMSDGLYSYETTEGTIATAPDMMMYFYE